MKDICDEIKGIKKLKLQKDDIVIIRVSRETPMKVAYEISEMFKDTMKKIGKNNLVMIVPEYVKVNKKKEIDDE